MSEAEPVNVLLVDDRPENLLALEAILEPLGQRLVRAHSGEEALRSILTTEFAVILLDVQMPGMDGFETARLIKSRERSKDVPIIFLTAINMEEQCVFQGYAVGAVDYMFKPLQPDTLRSKVSVFIDLYRKTKQVERHAELLRESEMRALELEHRARLSESEARLAQIVTSAMDAIIAADAGQRIVLFNAAAERMFRCSAAAVVGRPLDSLFAGQCHWTVVDRLTESSQTDASHRSPWSPSTLTAHRADGEEFPIEATISQLETREGTFYTVILRDMTERKRAEAELAARARQQATVALLGQRVLASTELQGLMDEVVRLVAHTLDVEFCTVLELAPDGTELLLRAGAGWPEGVVGRVTLPTGTRSQAGYTLRSASPVVVRDLRTETRFRGAPLLLEHGVVSALTVVIAGPNQAYGVLGAHTTRPHLFTEDDVNFLQAVAHVLASAVGRARAEAERERLLERERMARADAEAANRAKGEFLAVMSHELRTPLNAIRGYAQLLELGLRGPVTDAQKEDLGRIQRAERHLLGLISDILNYARIEAGRLEYCVGEVDLDAAVSAVQPLVEPQIQAKAISYEYRKCDPGITVHADAEKLSRIVLNLVSNALKFTGEGGHVSVSCGPACTLPERLQADLSSTRSDQPTDLAGFVDVCVADTGPGISADKLEAIFEPFVQLGRRLNNPAQGTGLGLAISRRLARGMGGELTVRSQLGNGSTFTLTLPRADPRI